jgi:hypothetical protein
MKTDAATTDGMNLMPLQFTVTEFSSESTRCKASALEQYNEDASGWHSEKGSLYPQRLALKINDENAVIDCLELLCHETKIPKKVDIDLGIGGCNSTSFEKCDSIRRLGYVIFKPGDGQSRELKAIPIGGKAANFIRLTFHGCHEGKENPHKQVGIVALRVLGQETKIGVDVPVTVVQVAPPTSLPLKIKNELDPKMLASVDRLERLKKERAAAEDFEMAATIKLELGKVYTLLIAFKESQRKMQRASFDEDYLQASKLKAERDDRKNAATKALAEVEQKFFAPGKILVENVGNLSISVSTIKDQSFASERPLKPNVYDNQDEETFYGADEEATNKCSSKEDSSHFGNGSSSEHPLAGVDGAEELPSPEEIRADVSTDLVHKVEGLLGSSYLTKCFFSRCWSLREAALQKMTLIIPKICSADTTDLSDVSEVLLSIIELSNSDKNVQVYLSGLILFDETLLQLERSGENSIIMTPLLSRILVDLFAKLADNSKKVADSAEISLLALAHSSSVDVSHVALLATKRIRSKEAKGGRTVRARLQFLENLSAEFGVEVSWKRCVDFAKGSNAFDHRDGSVRDAAKSLLITLARVNGANVVFRSLEDLNERLQREIQLGFKIVN